MADCRRCGREGHRAAECWFLTDIHGRTLDGRSSGNSGGSRGGGSGGRGCGRCGRDGHGASECWFLTDIQGNTLDDRSSSRGGRSSNPRGCERCGREGHNAGKCWFLTNINGETLNDRSASGGRDTSSSRDENASFHDVMRSAIAKINDFISDLRPHEKFYIGRAWDPDDRCENGHGASRWDRVWKSIDKEKIATVEEALIEYYQGHPRLDNESKESAGNWSFTHQLNYIYVAIGPWRG